MLPSWVKQKYSPYENWKDKPFQREDVRFFSKGLLELSELFTEERSRGIATYLNHSKFRSAYLLYFLPLQAAKFLTTFQFHPIAIQSALAHAKKTGTLHVADLGSGPGTASISFLLHLLDRNPSEIDDGSFKIVFDWFDTNSAILKDGCELVEILCSYFPKLRNRVEVRTHNVPWWKATTLLNEKTSLAFIGHVLNESEGPEDIWPKLMRKIDGGGLLIVEPAVKRAAQVLSKARNLIISHELPDVGKQGLIWGPCLHAGTCPFTEGRDWCHFSEFVKIPGDWFGEFSKALSSERHWVKFSYLWLASSSFPAPKNNPNLRRVLTDPMPMAGPSLGGKKIVLLCEPENAARYPIKPGQHLRRGDIL